jgi:hypothetical protein
LVTNSHRMIIGRCRQDEVGMLSVRTEAGAVIMIESLVHDPASTVGHGI